MSFQLYKSRLKCLLRNKEALFWSYLFPIVLATCFFFAFNNLWKMEDFTTISIAYDNEEVMTDELNEILKEAETSSGVKMFDVTYCSKEEAEVLLEEGIIEAYIVGSEKPVLTVKDSGLNETIVKSFLDSYRQMSVTISTILKENPNALAEGLIDDVMQFDSFVNEVISDKKPASILIYFYSLMAYTCIFAANWGLEEVINIQANLSVRGARVSVSPMNKMKLFLCNMLAAFTMHSGSMILLFLYLNYVVKINFGDNLLYLLLVCIIGSLTGLVLGGAVGIWVKKKAEVKEAILTFVILGGGFLSGMMFSNMKLIVEENFPLLSYINPVNLVTDAMFSLYYYDTYDSYYLNVLLLCVITIVCGVLSYIGIRRKSYASI